MMDISQSSYLSFLRETVEKDIEKLKKIAKEGEEEYYKKLPPPHSFAPDEIPTTLLPPPTHFEHTFEQPSRCTIPLAMVCLSTIELLGNLLTRSEAKGFQKGAKEFFEYAGISTTNPQRELLREIYRNGLMHSFFPKMEEFGVSYDSSLERKRELFIENKNRLILNVNFLSNTVLYVLNKLAEDKAKQKDIENRFIAIPDEEIQNLQKVVTNYKNNK